jgi:hypothetical protein
MGRTLAALLACTLSFTPAALLAQTAASRLPASQPDYVFPPGAGLLFFYVHPDKAVDFEAIVTRLAQVLDLSADPVRREQAASWRVFRSLERSDEHALYLFYFDPVVSGADYDPIKMLTEAVPTEVPTLYSRLKEAVIRVERMALGKLR